MTTQFLIPQASSRLSSAIEWTGRVWFVLAAAGQLAFILFILSFYGSRTILGNFEGWNDKQLITGHVEGDGFGNLMFGAHVLLAAVMTLSGLLQLIPHLRIRAPRFHRVNGRAFISLACFLAIGGLWMTWGRGSYLSIPTAIGVSLNGVLILLFSGLAIRFARRRDFVRHQIWALRTFMVASGVWFFRVGIMGWILINGGPRGMTQDLSGPADIALSFGSYLVPLLGLELYRLAKTSQSEFIQLIGIVTVSMLTVFMTVGILGAIFLMWF